MKFLTPKFWQYRTFVSYLLLPFSWLYVMSHMLRQLILKNKILKINIPVICVGNLTAGGAGKTPVALAIAELMSNPVFLTRGYGRTNQDTLRVNPNVHKIEQVGDEALILATRYPTWVGKNRYSSALQAVQQGAKVIIMDDGLQHLSLHQDCRIAVIDGAYGFGNELILPAGPLRENIISGLKYIDIVVIIGDDLFHIGKRFCNNIPIFRADFEVVQQDLDKILDKKIIAFAGIGRPQKFFDFLKLQGCDLLDSYSYPDHYYYQVDQLVKLQHQAKQKNAILVTTEKDYVRLPDEFKNNIIMCRVNLKFQNLNGIGKSLHEKISYAC